VDDQTDQPLDPSAAAALIIELREAVEARDDFIAVASHELRNPMTPMLGQVELLRAQARREGVPPAIAAGLDRLAVAIRRFVRRSTTLLDISRLNAGHLRLEPAQVDLAAVVREVAADHQAASRLGGSAVELHLPEGGMPGTWDLLAAEQIIENLIGNAIRYGGGRPVEVGLRSEAGDLVLLSVRDHGVGIAEADLPRLFGRFEQVVRRREQGGFGIGLWLTHKLVEAMGGSITVTSRVGEGSTFDVRLPRHMAGAEGNGS
jgi:signal transduction histidine kinase